MKSRFVLLLALAVAPAFGQLSTDQRLHDFRDLAAMYAKQYAPYEWKRDVVGFDLYLLAPWIDRIQKAKDDLEFYEILKQYVASLNDAHTYYVVPSTFWAYLGFDADIYDGKILLDTIDRTILSARQYPFAVGDEIVSIDGVSAADLVSSFMKYDSYANERATRRYFTDFLGYRDQGVLPRSSELGDSATVVVRRQAGALETYQIPWLKFGRPITKDGPVPSPIERSAVRGPAARGATPAGTPARRIPKPTLAPPSAAAAAGAPAAAAADDIGPAVRRMFTRKLTFKVPIRNIRGVDVLAPYYTLPSSFAIRLGRSSADAFYTGVFTSGAYKIGYLRIADFEPAAGVASAERQFQNEITYFQANTDGLVIDVTRNPGGDGCYAEDLLATLSTTRINVTGEELRPTLFWVNYIDETLTELIDYGYEQWQIDLVQAIQRDVESAFRENRGRTGAEGLCTGSLTEEPMTDRNWKPFGYTKPMLLLTDEFSSSAAEIFAAGFQDNGFGPLFGYRTTGAGGSIRSDGPFPAGYYSEGSANPTLSLIVRSKPVSVSGFPATNYIENIGVQPDIPYDYQTIGNLTGKGKPFVEAFTAAIVDRIQKAAKP